MSTIGRDRLKRLARLSDGKVRRADGLQLLEGRRLVSEALTAHRVTELFVRDEAAARRYAGMEPEIPVHCIGAQDMDRLAEVRTPQDVIGIGPLPSLLGVDAILAEHRRILLLDGVQDPGNAGSLVRTGAALGLSAVLLHGPTADITSPKVLRASAGTLFRSALGRVESAGALDDALATHPHTLVLPVVHGGRSPREVRVPDAFLLALGNEGAGTSLAGDPSSALRITIPMSAGVESLNVAAACAAILGAWL